ncbi:recombination O N terminal family protein [Orientia tsutsugamushi str. UT76]|nr:recombination O N terminal family protein [Orientia tsutsugamushi str. UT76]
MNFRDKAIILKKRNIKENLAIVTVLTQSYGIYSGIIKIYIVKKIQSYTK